MTRTVAWYEFLFTIKRPGYLILTFGLPFFVAAYAGFVALISAAAVGSVASGISSKIGVVDETGLMAAAAEADEGDNTGADGETNIKRAVPHIDAIKQFIERGRSKPTTFDSLDAGRKALRDGKIDGLVFVPADYVATSRIDYYSRAWQLFKGLAGPQQVRSELYVGVLQRADLTDDERALILSGGPKNPIGDTAYYELGPDGDFVKIDTLSRTLSFALPAGVAGLLIVALLVNAGFLLASVAEEKENKVFEVLFSIVRVDQLLLGKVIGLSGAALLQLVVWGAMMLPLPFAMFIALNQVVDFEWHFGALALAGVFFLLGFLFYGSLFVGLGALGNNVKESQQYALIIMFLPLIPMVLFLNLLNEPNGLVARGLAWFPPTGAPTMMLRLATGEVPLWDAAVAAVLLAGGVWLSIKISARLLLVGGMMRGQSPNPMKMLRLLLNR